MAMDWGPKSLGVSQIIYRKAVYKVRPVGEHLATLLSYIVENANGSSTLKDFHLIGHSLGAHVAGCAGNMLNGSVGRITGLGKNFSISSITYVKMLMTVSAVCKEYVFNPG